MVWKGLAHYGRILVYGAAPTQPELSYTAGSTATANKNYASMDPNYRCFRTDEIVRRCILVNAGFIALGGFETVLEPSKPITDEAQLKAFLTKYQYVKAFVDEVNKKVNMDESLFKAQVKCSIFGKSGFEIVGYNIKPSRLLSLQSPKLEAKLNENWEIDNFKYSPKRPSQKYDPDKILYFVNTDLDDDWEGLSDVEPIQRACAARDELISFDFPQIMHRMWAAFVHMQADTSQMTKEQAKAFLNQLTETARAGQSTAFNRKVESTVIDMRPDIGGLIQAEDKFEEICIRAFGTPRFLVNKSPENRATAYVEFEAFVKGVVNPKQRYYKRVLESDMWYGKLVKLALQKQNETIAEGEIYPVIKQNWKPVQASDIYAISQSVSQLWGNGSGILAEFPEIAFDMMGWNQELLQAWQKKQEEANNPTAAKAAVTKTRGKDAEGEFEEYVIKRRLPKTHNHN